MHPSPASGHGRRSSRTRCSGTSALAGPTWKDWSKVASASISTGSGTSSRRRRRVSAKLYALPGAMHSGFMQFAAFDQDAIDNKAFMTKGKLSMPVLAIGGDKSFGATMAKIMQFAASNVREGVIPESGHWIMEENPRATIAMVRAFLEG